VVWTSICQDIIFGGSLVNSKSFRGSSVISKDFGGNPVNCRIVFQGVASIRPSSSTE
jgi:hypothetical protein